MEKWSKLEDSLIDQVRAHPILYTSNAKSYKHLMIKENTWRDIAVKLGLTRRECKSKWKGIRDGYRRCRIMEMKGRVGRKSKYSDDRLLFLRSGRDEEEEKAAKEEKMSIPFAQTDQFGTLLSQHAEQIGASGILHPEQNGGNGILHAEQNGGNGLVHYEQNVLQDELRRSREERYEYIRLLNNFAQPGIVSESPIHSFFRSMADVVCQLPPHRITEVRVKVCNLVSDIEMQVMQECSPADQLEMSMQTSPVAVVPSAPDASWTAKKEAVDNRKQ